MSHQPGSDNIHARQLEGISRKETEIYYQRLKDVADRAVEISKRTMSHYLRICRLISPERVKEIEEKYQGVSLDELEPIEELTMSITSAVNLLLLAAASAKVNVEDALRKLHDENMALAGQLKQSTQSIHQLQRENAYLRKENERRDQPKGKERGRSLERSTGAASEASRTPELQAPGTEGMPAQPVNVGGEEAPEEARIAPVKRIPTGDKNFEEMEMGAALATWKEIVSHWTEKQKEMYFPLIEIIGTGMVKKAEIQAWGESELKVDEKSIERRLYALTKNPVLLKVRKYGVGEGGKAGRKPAAFEFTTLGKAAYRSLTGRIEAAPDDVVLMRAHKDPNHADLVKRTASALTRLGFVATPNNAPIQLEDGTMFDPDLRVTGPDMELFFMEAESPTHMKYKELHTKWALAARVNGNKIYLVMRSASDAEGLGCSTIREWAYSVNYPEEITVCVTGLDALENMQKPQNGKRVSPWTMVKTIKPTRQKELIP